MMTSMLVLSTKFLISVKKFAYLLKICAYIHWSIFFSRRKLFELLVLCGAQAELAWPAILSKRHIFRYCS